MAKKQNKTLAKKKRRGLTQADLKKYRAIACETLANKGANQR